MNQNELYDIYSLWHTPFWQKTWFLLVVALLACVVIGVGVWFYIQKIKKDKRKKTSWDQALHELDQLNYSKESSEGKEFYNHLLLIIKNYLHDRYGYDVASKTDQELLHYLSSISFPQDLLEPLQGIVEGSVIIRFASDNAVHDQMQRDLSSTVSMIKKTIPQSHKR